MGFDIYIDIDCGMWVLWVGLTYIDNYRLQLVGVVVGFDIYRYRLQLVGGV